MPPRNTLFDLNQLEKTVGKKIVFSGKKCRNNKREIGPHIFFQKYIFIATIPPLLHSPLHYATVCG